MITKILIASLLVVLSAIYQMLNFLVHKNKRKYNKYLFSSNLMLTFINFATGYFVYYVFNDLISNFYLRLLASLGIIMILVSTIHTIVVILSKNNQDIKLKRLKLFMNFSYYLFYPFALIENIYIKENEEEVDEDLLEEEFLEILEQSEADGSINEEESELIKTVLEFDDLLINDILTPRTDIIGVQVDSTKEEIQTVFMKSGYSRLPVYDESLDDIIGTIHFKDFYNKVLNKKRTIKSIMTKPLEVTEYMAVKNLLSLLKLNKQHIAVVKDEYGGTVGIVTLEDVLEELVGDIFDEHDKVNKTYVRLDNERYKVNGTTQLYELEEIFTEEMIEDVDYTTINGFIQSNLGKIAAVKDTFIFQNLEVTVTKADQKMVQEAIIKVLDISEEKGE